jgi:hypothetical protein
LKSLIKIDFFILFYFFVEKMKEKTLEKSKGVVEFVNHAHCGERGGIC